MLWTCAVPGSMWTSCATGQSLSTTADGNQPRISVVPSIRTVYDSNALRLNSDSDGPKDNVRVTPGVDVAIRRTLGRIAINASGSIGYDYNSRYRFLNRTRIEATGRATGPIGALCRATLDTRYQQFQFDLGDVDQIIGTTTRQQYYDAEFQCALTGITPTVGVTYTDRSSSSSLLFNSNSVSVRGGLNYSRPSLGIASLTVSRGRLRRPGTDLLIGFDDGTDTTQVQLSLVRNIAPRLGFTAGIGYVRADPLRAGVDTFSGPSFNSQITWRPHPRFVVDGSAQRQVTNQTGFNATYVLREDYQLGVSWRLTRASRVTLSASQANRDFRGREALPLATPINHDKTQTLTGAYSFDTARVFRFTFAASKRWRDADAARYDFSSTVMSVSVGAKFQ
jgi:hypothetical protein